MIQVTVQGDPSPPVIGLLEQTLGKLVGLRGVRHAVLGVEAGNGDWRWTGAAGQADPTGSPMTPETPYCLASVTKLYIGCAVLRLQEQGRLSLEDRLVDILPAEWLSGLHRYRGVDHTATLTLRHLIAHASGLPEYLAEAPRGQLALLDEVVKSGDMSWDIEEVLRRARAVDSAHFAPRSFAGRRFRVHYSDTNFQLLMAVMEAVTGQSTDVLFDTLICEPLGLSQTWQPGSPAAASMPAAAVPWAGDTPMQVPMALQSFRDLFSTAEETLCFIRSLLSGTIFDDPATAGLMQQQWNPFGFSLLPIAPSWPIEYGLALMRFTTPAWLRPLMDTGTLIGHSGATGSWLFYAPEADLYVSGTVDQLTAAAVPYRQLPGLIKGLRGCAGKR